ncbi:MAG TPA: hypothetical protein VGR07_00735 [Thermoanaerobaculia bacterium]|jgi:hypothetical protein|nr:hypothetical protein [Thermoanaerobaculia bacterium]
MKKRLKKMSLNRETLRQLDAIDFGRIAGGASDIPQCPPSHRINTCYTCYNGCFPTLEPTCDVSCNGGC